MNLSSLLRQHLKDDNVIRVLEAYEIDDVIYMFDRLHENTPEKYWAQAKQAGFQLGFDERQILNVVFCYITESEGFKPIDTGIIGVPLYSSFRAAEDAVKGAGTRYTVAGPTMPEAWLRTEAEDRWVNYQFKNGVLARVSIFIPW